MFGSGLLLAIGLIDRDLAGNAAGALELLGQCPVVRPSCRIWRFLPSRLLSTDVPDYTPYTGVRADVL